MADKNNDDFYVDKDLAASFLADDQTKADARDWIESEKADLPGQLALDIYETKERLIVKCRVAGVNKDELDVSIQDNNLSIKGTLSPGIEDGVDNYFIQECYWGDFSRSISLPVAVKEDDEIEAILKDGILTVSFVKIKQDIVKKISIK